MSAKLALADLLALPNSAIKIPRLGFGVYDSPPSQSKASCLHALKTGYRHIDTAQYYRNEAEVGSAIAQSGLPRSEVFVTTKILSAARSPEETYRKCLESVRTIDPRGGDDGYVDLFLVHSPSSGRRKRQEMWQALERLLVEGRTKSIGVSNYGIGVIEEMQDYAKIWPPQVNQIELHPWCQQREVVEYCAGHDIVVEAYSPLVQGRRLHDETLNVVAKRHGRTAAQVLIRYSLQKGWVPLPKSDTPSRIEENMDVYGFELEPKDMKMLDDLDEGSDGAILRAVVN